MYACACVCLCVSVCVCVCVCACVCVCVCVQDVSIEGNDNPSVFRVYTLRTSKQIRIVILNVQDQDTAGIFLNVKLPGAITPVENTACMVCCLIYYIVCYVSA